MVCTEKKLKVVSVPSLFVQPYLKLSVPKHIAHQRAFEILQKTHHVPPHAYADTDVYLVYYVDGEPYCLVETRTLCYHFFEKDDAVFVRVTFV